MMNHYRLSITIHPNTQEVAVEGTLHYFHHTDATQQLKLYIHKDFKNIRLKSQLFESYLLDQTAPPLHYLACSKPIVITLREPVTSGNHLEIHFSYEGQLDFGDFPIGSITEEFVELGIYAPVFPVTEEMGNAKFELSVACDSPMTFVHAQLENPLFDFALIGSRHFNEQKVFINGVTVYYILESDAIKAKNVAIMCVALIRYYTQLFGELQSSELSVVITPRTEGGGYGREGLIVLSTDFSEELYAEDILGYLAHEIAHLWWHHAPINTYEDWLNESFAEYSRMIACKKRFGEAWYEKRLAKYKETYNTTPPIIGLDRNDPQAFDVLYKKGTAILCDTFRDLSTNMLTNMFHAIHYQRIASTDALILNIEEFFSDPHFASDFRAKLERL